MEHGKHARHRRRVQRRPHLIVSFCVSCHAALRLVLRPVLRAVRASRVCRSSSRSCVLSWRLVLRVVLRVVHAFLSVLVVLRLVIASRFSHSLRSSSVSGVFLAAPFRLARRSSYAAAVSFLMNR